MTKALIAALVAVSLASAAATVAMQPAFAHAHTSLVLTDERVAGKRIEVVLGHTNEPAYGARPGIHDGKHGMEVLLSDGATKLPLAGASLKADKYYFKDIKSFARAKSVNDADAIVKGVNVGAVFGETGHYVTRQVQKEGIYGYRLYGNISYFGVAQVPVDSTVFCRSSQGDTSSRFNSPGWAGGFGCTENISGQAFPAAATGGGKDVKSTSGVEQQDDGGWWWSVWLSSGGQQYALLLPAAAAAAAGVFGWRSRIKKKGTRTE
ncbi:hypothetical protein [Nitrososphaera sp.]|uniref:hypothetical protein n=1 Tax=Nitrososphaera sp. TaxID=1971748 RepID=UPI00307F5ECA